MRIALGLVLLLWMGAFSRVLADPPPASSATPPQAASDAKAAVVTQAQADAVSADGVTKEELKRLQAAGYKRKTRGNQIVYCRVEVALGTRFDREMCANARELELIRANGQEMATHIQRSNAGAPKGGH